MFRSMFKTTFMATVALISGMAADFSLDGGLVMSKARAVIGRPVTPMS